MTYLIEQWIVNIYAYHKGRGIGIKGRELLYINKKGLKVVAMEMTPAVFCRGQGVRKTRACLTCNEIVEPITFFVSSIWEIGICPICKEIAKIEKKEIPS